MKKFSGIGVVLVLFTIIVDAKFDYSKRWIIPEGWKIPDVSVLKLSQRKTAKIVGVNKNIDILFYDGKDANYSYFDKKVKLEDGKYFVYLDNELRMEVKQVILFKADKKVLLYYINYFAPERIIVKDKSNKLYNAGYDTVAEQSIIIDLDGDGIFESSYNELPEFWNDITLSGIPDFFKSENLKSKRSVLFNLLLIKLLNKIIPTPKLNE